MATVSGEENGWPRLEELHSGEAILIRKALVSLGHQQMEILGSIEGLGVKIEDGSKHTDAVERRLRQQLVDVRASVDVLTESLATIGTNASETRGVVDKVHKLLKQVQLSDRFVSTPPPSEVPSIPPPLTLGDKVDWKRTPMGGIKLDQKDQALLAQRMARLEEERRVADAIAADRAATIAAQKKEAEEKRLADERKAEADRVALDARTKLEIEKSKERRAWMAVYIGMATTFGGGVVWLFHALHH
jgi:hypothetical protein